MRILVTGSSGQLGSALVEQLSTEHEVVGIDLVPAPHTGRVIGLDDRPVLDSLLSGMDAVIHVASLHARHLSSHSRAQFVETNVQGTLNLLEAAVRHNIQRFVYTSTTSLYGHAMAPIDRAVWVTEDLHPQPRDIYDVTKIAAEGLCRVFTSQYGLPCVCLRVSRFFPEPAHLMALYRMYRGVDVRDAVSAHWLALMSDLPEYSVYNISARPAFLPEDVIQLYENAPLVMEKRIPDVVRAFTEHGWELPTSIDRVYSIEKAERELGYHPKYNVNALL